ncbi:MAG: hypothetical protein Q4D07_04145 [Selenomonadaceae bacterium]|nr:hypothetical protein [Selenomonadaceae bacterium]
MTEKEFLNRAEEIKSQTVGREPLLSRIQRRRKKQRRELVLIIAVFTVLLGGWLWRSIVYARTPDYALKQISDALESKDGEKFDRYVKLDAITMVAFDDLTTTLFQYDHSLTPSTHKKFLDFYQHIKPQLAQGTAETIRRFVSTGEWSLPTGADLLKGRQLGIDYDRFLERSQLRNTELLSLESVSVNSSKTDEAVGKIKIRDKYTGTEFTMDILLERQSDGRWCVIALENYRDYLSAVTDKQVSDISAYIEATQPVVDEYNSRFISQRERFRSIVRQGRPMSDIQIQQMKQLVLGETVPDLKARQEKLNSFDIRAGSQYLSSLRRQSTDLTIAAWVHLIAGLEKEDYTELNLAETLHKQMLEVDLRIEDVINHNTVSQEMPEVP